MKKLGLFVLFIGSVIWAFSFDSTQTVDHISLTDTVYRIDDRDTAAFVEFTTAPKNSVIRGEVFKVATANGSIEYQGRAMVFIYLTGNSYETFLNKYSGDIKRCPATFLNARSKTVHLFPKTVEIYSELHEHASDLKSGQESATFELQGRNITFRQAKAANGRAARVDYGGQEMFLVESVKTFR